MIYCVDLSFLFSDKLPGLAEQLPHPSLVSSATCGGEGYRLQLSVGTLTESTNYG